MDDHEKLLERRRELMKQRKDANPDAKSVDVVLGNNKLCSWSGASSLPKTCGFSRLRAAATGQSVGISLRRRDFLVCPRKLVSCFFLYGLGRLVLFISLFQKHVVLADTLLYALCVYV